jgi:hypothetical protein
VTLRCGGGGGAGVPGGGLEYLDRQALSCRGRFGDSLIESFRMIGNGNGGECSSCVARYRTTCVTPARFKKCADQVY